MISERALTFVGLVFGLSVPFWFLGAFTGIELLPGLPVSALMAACPAVAALAITWTAEEKIAARALLLSGWTLQRANLQSAAAAAVAMPVLIGLAWIWMRSAGVAMPDPDISVRSLFALFLVFLVAAIAEELGWSGYLARHIRQQHSFAAAAIIIGTVWAVWHVPALLQAGRDTEWIAWWALGTIATRIIALGLFEWTNQNVCVVSIFHAAQNTAWQAFPDNGSHYDPAYTAPIFTVAAIWVLALHMRQNQRQ